jgi:general secretion pathway protein D
VGDLPVLGQLFRYDTRKHSKTNLLVFLKPTVVRTPAAAAALTVDRYDYLMGEQQRLRPPERFFWDGEPGPKLPPLPGSLSVPTPMVPPPAAPGLGAMPGAVVG